MDWLLIAILAYFILAIVNVADKFILENVIPGARTYTFLVGLTGLVVFVLAPWFLNWPGIGLFLFNMLVGGFFAGGLFFLYSALKDGEASRIFTLVGGAVPIFTVIFSVLFFKESFTSYQWLAIVFLILGTMLISAGSTKHSIWFGIKHFLHLPESKRTQSILFAFVAALFFALFWVGTKFAYNYQEFMSGFIWIRGGTFLTVLFLLITRESREEIFSELKKSNSKKNNKFIFLTTQGMGAAGTLLQNYAVSLGSVALVTSLQGLQYALLLILTFIITVVRPKIVNEDNSGLIVLQKMMSILLITFGLYFLTV